MTLVLECDARQASSFTLAVRSVLGIARTFFPVMALSTEQIHVPRSQPNCSNEGGLAERRQRALWPCG